MFLKFFRETMFMHMPCEIISREYLPVIRNLLTYELVVVRGYSQQDAAHVLGITQAAVAQYLHKIRGNKKVDEIKHDRELIYEIKKLASNLKNMNREEKMLAFCNMCKILRKNGHLEKHGFTKEEAMRLCGRV